MARLVGIDVRSTVVRMALLRTSYRGVGVEALAEVDLASFETKEDAIRALLLERAQPHDSVAIALPGDRVFVHVVNLPASAAKQIAEVLPFELEAMVPIDFEEVTYDFSQLPRRGDQVPTLAVAARTEDVAKEIQLIERSLGRQPERIGAGGLPLANLAAVSPALREPGPIAIVDFGQESTDVVIFERGVPVFVRTASAGVAGLPDSAPLLLGAIRQTLAAWASAGGSPVGMLYLAGGGASTAGASAYFAHELGVGVQVLPPLSFDKIAPEYIDHCPQFAKAIGIAMGLRSAAKDLDLRQGTLSYQRGYGFIKQKLPTLAGVAALLVVSFFFATWAESKALAQENEVLASALEKLTQEVLGQPTADPEAASVLIDRGGGAKEKDPRPELDAFDVMVALSEAVPKEITHDVDELDVARGHVKIRGVVGSTQDAEKVAENLKQKECFDEVKIGQITQVVNSEQQRYVLEFEIKCEEGGSEAKGAKEKGE